MGYRADSFRWVAALPEECKVYCRGVYSGCARVCGAHLVKLNMTWHFPDRAIKVKSQKNYEDNYVLSSPKVCALCFPVRRCAPMYFPVRRCAPMYVLDCSCIRRSICENCFCSCELRCSRAD